MKFVVEHVSKGGGRLGKLSGLRSQPDTIHNTPLSLISTIGGSAPHLTQDVLHLVANREVPLCVPAQHFCQHRKVLNSFEGVAHFAALKSHSVSVVVQDPTKLTPHGYNDKQGVSTWSTGGRHILSPQWYMELVEAMQPDWYEALCDADTPPDASKKRLSKSITQSMLYVNTCIQHHKKSQFLHGCGLLLPLLGGHSLEQRARWSSSVSPWLDEHSMVSGYVLQGLHANGPDVELITPEQVTHLVRTSLESLPEGRPCQAGGSWNPCVVVSLVEAGVDLFDSSFPYMVTQRNGALTFPHQLHRGNVSRQSEDVSSLQHQDKKLKVCAQDHHQGKEERRKEKKQHKEGQRTEQRKETQKKEEEAEESHRKIVKSEDEVEEDDEEELPTSVYEICLKDKRYMLDQGPLVNGCICYTCTNFSRAYIHHLINVKEMLAPVLLMIHNLHHWTGFFCSIREAVKTNCLQDLKAILSSLSKE